MKCEACTGDHRYAFQARECEARRIAQANRAAAKVRTTPNSERKPTDNQLKFLADLAYKKGIKGFKTPVSFAAASRAIDYMKAQPDVANPATPGPVISFTVTNLIPDGRYAVRIEDQNEQFVFIRVSRPKTRNLRGTLVVQSQHGPDYVKRLHFNLTTGDTLYQNNRKLAGLSLADVIALIVVSPQKAAFDYAQEKGVCCSCGTELTDRKSVYFGIGPDCVKKFPGYTEWVEQEKGVFK